MHHLVSLLLTAIVFVGFTRDCHAGLVISEIFNNPTLRDGVTSDSNEWFEVFNSGPGSVNLSNIRFDDDGNASDGVSLSGNLSSGRYAVVGNLTQAAWEALYAPLPTAARYIQLTPWNILNNGTGDTLSLYNTITSSNFFSVTYGASSDGVSLEYTGTNANQVSPYAFGAGQWQNATSSPGGSSGHFHSAGQGNLVASTAPEPATWAMLGIAACGLAIAVRRRPAGQVQGQLV